MIVKAVVGKDLADGQWQAFAMISAEQFDEGVAAVGETREDAIANLTVGATAYAQSARDLGLTMRPAPDIELIDITIPD